MNTTIFVGKGASERQIAAKMIGRWIHVARCIPPKQLVGVAMAEMALAESEDVRDSSVFFEILSLGETCRYFRPEDIGGFVCLPASPLGLKQWSFLVGPGELFIREEWFEHPDGNGLPVLAVFRG